MADNAPPTQQDMFSARQAKIAAEATSAERPQGGGTAARQAMQAASRIQPNTSIKTERPIFVPTTPETAEERQQRRGVPLAKSSSQDDAPQVQYILKYLAS